MQPCPAATATWTASRTGQDSRWTCPALAVVAWRGGAGRNGPLGDAVRGSGRGSSAERGRGRECERMLAMLAMLALLQSGWGAAEPAEPLLRLLHSASRDAATCLLLSRQRPGSGLGSGLIPWPPRRATGTYFALGLQPGATQPNPRRAPRRNNRGDRASPGAAFSASFALQSHGEGGSEAAGVSRVSTSSAATQESQPARRARSPHSRGDLLGVAARTSPA